MNLYSFEGKTPQVDPEAFVAPTATLVGDVVVEKGASIWYGVVLRGDDCRIVVREGANVQDNSVLHAAPGKTLEIGPGATIAHACVIHGDSVGERALIANGTVMLDDTTGELFVLEINAIPGLTETSLLPQAADEAGISFDEMVSRVLATADAL